VPGLRACHSSLASTATLPAAFGKIHPRWRTPHVSDPVQAICSVARFLRSGQINETTRGAYQFLVDATIILYFIPFHLHVCGGDQAVSAPDGAQTKMRCSSGKAKAGVWTSLERAWRPC